MALTIKGGQEPGRNDLKDIPGFGGAYSITTDGRIWSKFRKDRLGRPVKGGWLRQRQDDFGRFDVSLQVNNISRRFLIHRLILETYVGPCPEGMECCHNDGNPTNNKLTNLRWDTHLSNSKDAVKHKTCPLLNPDLPRPIGARHHKSKLTDIDIGWIRYLRKTGILLRDLADFYKVTETTISYICNRRIWKHVYND